MNNIDLQHTLDAMWPFIFERIGSVQAPQGAASGIDTSPFLLRSGDTITGDIGVVTGIKIDGIDISRFAGDVNAWQSNHLVVGDPHPQYALLPIVSGTPNRLAKFNATTGVGVQDSLLLENTIGLYLTPPKFLSVGGFERLWRPGVPIGGNTYIGTYGTALTYNVQLVGGAWQSLGGGNGTAIVGAEGRFTLANTNAFTAAGQAVTWADRLTMDVAGRFGINALATSTDQVYIASAVGSAGNSALKILYPGGGGLANTEFAALAHRNSVWNALYAKQGSAANAALFDGRVDVIGLVQAEQGIEVNAADVTANNTYGIYWHGSADRSYAIYRQAGGWGSPFPRLQATWNTGIDLRATISHGGTRFYDYNSGGGSQPQLMSVGEGDSNVRVTNNLFVSGAGNSYVLGNFGVGTTSPTAKFQVVGTGGGSIDAKFSGRIAVGTPGLGGVWIDGGASQFVGSYSPTVMGLYNNGWWNLILNSAGNVGIKTLSPITPLDVAGSTSTLQNGVRHYRNAAHYFQNGVNITGALLITMPNGWVSTMMKIVIEGYDYSGSAAWRCVVGGYNYSVGGWYNTDCEITGNAPFRSVTLAYDVAAAKCVLVLGTTSTIWQYPQIVISDFLAGYGGMDSWGSGWNLAITASLPALTYGNAPSPTFTAAGHFSSLGSVAGYYFEDRTGGNQWVLYASGGAARLFAGAAGDRFTIDQIGNATIRYDASNMLTVSVSSVGNVTLTPSGSLINFPTSASLRSPNYASQTTGWNISGLGEIDARYIYTDELRAREFVAEIVRALAGAEIVSKSVAMLATDFAVPAAGGSATLALKDHASAPNMALFQAGDVVRLRQFSWAGGGLSITDCWGTVTGYTDGSGASEGTQSWSFTRSVAPNAGAMTAGSVITKDATVIDYGVSGNGYIETNAIDGVYGLNAPYVQTVTWTGHPHTGLNVRGRYGNLRGLTGVTGEFGIVAGTGWTATPTATDKFIKASSTGVDIYNAKVSLYDASTPVIVLDPATPSLAIGNPAPSGYLSSTGIFAGKHGGAYKMHVGSIASGVLQRGYSWDGTNFDVVGNIRIGPGSASYGVNIGNPRIMLRFDGPVGDFTGDATGHRGQKATISGGVIFVPGKFGKAVQVAEETTNLIPNPSAEVNAAGYVSDFSVTVTQSAAHALYGAYAISISYASGGTKNFYRNDSGLLLASRTYTFSCYVKRADNGVVSGVSCYIDSTLGAVTPTIFACGNGWYRVVATRTTGSSIGNNVVGLNNIDGGTVWYTDGWQLEASPYATPYCDGSLGAEHSWNGAAHDSTSTRAVATLSYPTAYQIRGDRGTIGCWLNTDGWASWGSTTHILVSGQDAGGGSQFLRFSTNGSSLIFVQRSTNGVLNQIVATIPVSAKNGGWHHFSVTWNGAQAVLYADGVQIGSGAITGTMWGEQTQWPTMWVGSDGSSGYLPVPIDDLFVTDTFLAADEIRAIYQSNQPVGIDSSPYSLMLRGPSGGYVLGDSTGLYGYSATGGMSFALAAADGVSAYGGTLNAGDFKFGSSSQYVSYVGGTLTIAGNGSGITSINGGNILTGTVTAQKLLATAGGDNLVLNASFEADSDTNGVGDSWGIYNNSAGTEPHTASRITGIDGGYAQRVAWTGTNTTSKGVYSLATWVGGRRANMTYIVSWWARANTNVAVGFDTQHNIGPNLLNEWVSNPTPAIGVWQRYVKRQKWSADNSDPLYISLAYTAAVTGSVDIDHVMVHEGDVPQAYMPRAAEVLPGTVVANMIAANAITATHISAGAITTGAIAAGAITTGAIAAGAITAGTIAAGAVVAGKIAAGAIDAMTITGAVIRTAASGARVEMSGSQIFGTDGATTQWSANGSGFTAGGTKLNSTGLLLQSAEASSSDTTVGWYPTTSWSGAATHWLKSIYTAAGVSPNFEVSAGNGHLRLVAASSQRRIELRAGDGVFILGMSGNPVNYLSGGGTLFVDVATGALKYIKPNGSVTTIVA